MSLHLTSLSYITDHFAGIGKVITSGLRGDTKKNPEEKNHD